MQKLSIIRSTIWIGVFRVVELKNFQAKVEFRDNLFRTLRLSLLYLAPASSFCFYWVNFKVIVYQMSCIYIISIIAYKCIISVNICDYIIIAWNNLVKGFFSNFSCQGTHWTCIWVEILYSVSCSSLLTYPNVKS